MLVERAYDKSLVVYTTHNHHAPVGRRRRREIAGVCIFNFMTLKFTVMSVKCKFNYHILHKL